MNPRHWAWLRWLANWQVLVVACLAPFFILADRLPNWAVALAVLAVPLPWCIYRVVNGHFFTSTPADIPLLILAATLPIGVWVSALSTLSLPPLLQTLFGLTLFYALVNSLNSARKVEMAGWAVVTATALIAGLSLVGTAWGTGSKFLPVGLRQHLPYLLGSVWNTPGFNPNRVGGVLALLVPVTVAFAWAARTWPRRLFLGLLLVGEGLTILLTQSRGALVGLAVGLAVVAIGRDRRWAWLVPIGAAIGAVGLVLYGVQPSLEYVTDSIGTSAILSVEGRLGLWSSALRMLHDFPFTGVGLGMFSSMLALFPPLSPWQSGAAVPHAHNIYLQMGIDHGLPGLIAFVALVLLLWQMGTQAIRSSRDQPWEPLAIGLLAGLAVYLVHGLTDAIWHTHRSEPIIWGHFGLLTAVWCWTRCCPRSE